MIDLLNPEAVRGYLEQAYTGTWLERFGAHFGKTVRAIWVDEPHFRPPLLPWSDALPDRFRDRWGTDLIAQVPQLFGPGRGAEVRHQYWRVVVEMLEEAYIESVREWCERHGVRFGGHLMGEDTLNSQVAWTGAAMPLYAHMHVPGIDHLTKSLTWPSGRKFILPPVQCASAAHQLNKPLVLSEMYAVSTQGLTYADRRQIAAWLMALGVNYRCYHGSFYSMRGRRKRLFETLEGVELEAIYLTGDFAVRGVRSSGPQVPRCVRLEPTFTIAAEGGSATGELVSEGYPFYAGRLTLSEVVRLRAPGPGERVVLALPTIDAAALAHVDVNGARAGTIAWAPYEVDVTQWVREGENEIAVTLVSTLRNLLGPHHRPEGEPDACWGTDFTLYPAWAEDPKERQAHWTDDHFFLRLGVPDGVYIAYMACDPGEGS